MSTDRERRHANSRCQCSMSISMLGDGCRYCQPQEHIDRLLHELQNESQDSEKYRYLRSRDLDAIQKGGIFVGMTPDNVVLNEEDLDAAIDAAMAREAACD